MTELEFIHLTEKTGALIQRKRETLNLSQSELAELTGASVQQISNYEKGDYDIALERLFELAGKLDLSVAELLAD